MDIIPAKKSPDTSVVPWAKPASNQSSNSRKKKKIYDEDTFTEEMEKIVTRDFFPDLNKLKAQNEYIEAMESGDMAKIQEIQTLYKPRILLGQSNSLRRPFNTPTAFETPDITGISRSSTPSQTATLDIDCPSDEVDLCSSEKKKTKSLDEFLAGATSEDNVSFEEIMEKDAIQHQKKYPWLYKDEAEEQRQLTASLSLPSNDQNAIEDNEKKAITWAYKNKNALMYVPDGVELTVEEKVKFASRQKIQYPNTRFAASPFDEQANKAAIAEAASVQAKMKEGKVGIDGKELVPEDSPKVNGYGFMGMPSPAPGVTDTPILTWGEIEGTPFRLDGSDTPLPENPSGQHFKMPEIPARERLALSLADKASKKNRKKKQDALRHAKSSWLTPSPKFGSSTPLSPMEKLYSMSPAAQKLVCAKLGIHRNTDRALRASYTPSPSHTPLQDQTPEIPSPVIKTPDVHTPKTCSSVSHDTSADVPKRQKAMDFF